MSFNIFETTEETSCNKPPKDYQKSGLINFKKQILGVEQPQTTQELIKIIKNCNKLSKPFYVVSTGKNWGYGKASPVFDDNLLIDMSSLNKIHHFDTQLGVVEIEPGVTQGQLADYLADSPWMLDCTGAGPQTSIMGNVLERGFGHGGQGYRSRNFTITQCILANGETKSLDTSPRYIGRAGHAAGLTELFTQNNIAVVTKIRFELALRQQQSLRCLVRLKNVDDIGNYIDIIRRLKAEHTVDTLPHIGNNYRMISMISQFDFYNWDPNSGPKVEDLIKLQKDNDIMPWTAAFIVSGNPKVAKAKSKRIKQALCKIADVKTISLDTLINIDSMLKNVAPYLKNINRFNHFQDKISKFKRAMVMFEGNPNPMAIKGCYWRNKVKQKDENRDPIDENCGFYWIAPALPMIGEEVNKCVNETQVLFNNYGFEFGITLTSITAHLCQAIISLYYDTTNQHEKIRAKALIQQLRELYTKNKWQCYRRSVDEMPFYIANELEQDALIIKSKIKHALNPANLINPGRYQAKLERGLC